MLIKSTSPHSESSIGNYLPPPPGMIPVIKMSVDEINYYYDLPQENFHQLIGQFMLAIYGVEPLCNSPVVDLEQALMVNAILKRGAVDGRSQRLIDRDIRDGRGTPNLRRLIGRFLLAVDFALQHKNHIKDYKHYEGAEYLGSVDGPMFELEPYNSYITGNGLR